MAKTPGYTKYECDRVEWHSGDGGMVEYLTDTNPRRNDWVTIKRISAAGTTVEHTYCPECAAAYKQLSSQQDDEYTKFRTAKKGE